MREVTKEHMGMLWEKYYQELAIYQEQEQHLDELIAKYEFLISGNSAIPSAKTWGKGVVNTLNKLKETRSRYIAKRPNETFSTTVKYFLGVQNPLPYYGMQAHDLGNVYHIRLEGKPLPPDLIYCVKEQADGELHQDRAEVV